MKRWFCGFSSAIDSSVANLPKPFNGEMLWQGANPFWVCGNWAKQQIITLFEGSVRLAIVGTCLEPYETLVELFQNAVRNRNYSRLMRLPGNYNLIVQDGSDTYVFADVAGLRPVFYAEYSSCIVYSSLGVPLQQLIKAEVDLAYLANSLAGLTMLNVRQNRSPFCQVQAIPPGHYLQITSGKPICQRYWTGPLEYSSFSEAAEQLREQLLTAVEGRVRLYGNVTSDLSGGFDSTSLALIAAKNLATRGQKLHTMTLKTVAASESEDVKWAQHAASLYPNIVSIILEDHKIPADYSNLESIPLTDTPEISILYIGQISYLMEVIRSKESQLHLSGDGGDAVLLAPPSYLADLLRRAQIRTFFQHTYGWSRIFLSSPVALMNSAVGLSLTSYRQWLLQQVKKLRSHKFSKQLLNRLLTNQPPANQIIGWEPPPDIVSWYTKKSVDLVLAELEKWATVATPFANSPGQHESITTIQWGGFTAKVDQELAATYDVNFELPYFDSLVVDACLSAKPEERSTPFTYKPLLSRALHRDLPKSIFTRTTKGDYTTDEFIGFRQNLTVINELFQNSLLADMGLIDLREVRAAMKQFGMGLAAVSTSFQHTLTIELWLRRLVDASNRFWM